MMNVLVSIHTFCLCLCYPGIKYGTAQRYVSNLTPTQGQQVQHLKVILVPLITGMQVTIGIFPVSSKACLQ